MSPSAVATKRSKQKTSAPPEGVLEKTAADQESILVGGEVDGSSCDVLVSDKTHRDLSHSCHGDVKR